MHLSNFSRSAIESFWRTVLRAGPVVFLALSWAAGVRADEPNSRLEARLTEWIQIAHTWAAAPEVVATVRAQNLELSPALKAITQERWAAIEGGDELLRSLRANPAAKFMRKSRSACISEAFVNDAAGNKVAMLEKTTSWNHRRSAKHEQPMAGRVYCSPIIYDESSATKVVQISVPVMDGGVPIGSLVLGVNVYEIARKGGGQPAGTSENPETLATDAGNAARPR